LAFTASYRDSFTFLVVVVVVVVAAAAAEYEIIF
jgi:hypothetical protein